MKGTRKKQEDSIPMHVDIAINTERIAIWADKNGFKWQNFAYWKFAKEYSLREVYELFKQKEK